jgi:hypothetical protein
MEADVATRASRPAGWLRAPLLPPGMEAASPREIASAFGTGFAAEVDEAPVRGECRLGMYVRLPESCSGAPAHGSSRSDAE